MNNWHPFVKDFVEKLEAEGSRVTSTRRILAGEVASQDGQFSAEMIWRQLPSVGRATVYRTIKVLVDMGFVCRVLMSDGNLRYQISHKAHHHHMICGECGISIDLVGCHLDDLLMKKAEAQGFDIQGHWLEVYGKCNSCRSLAKAS